MMTTIMTKTMIIMMIWIINVVRPSFQNCATYLSICQKDSFLPSSVVGCFVFREASFSVLSWLDSEDAGFSYGWDLDCWCWFWCWWTSLSWFSLTWSSSLIDQTGCKYWVNAFIENKKITVKIVKTWCSPFALKECLEDVLEACCRNNYRNINSPNVFVHFSR